MKSKKLIFTTCFLANTLLISCSAPIDTQNNDDNINIFAKRNSDRNVVNIIKKANAEYEKRNPELINLKYQGMKESAHSFFRATNYIFYQDLAQSPFFNGENISIQGDLHLENIGSYKTSSGSLSYDLNDFDDATSGSYTWDITRCATSIVLTSQENGFSKDDSEKFSKRFLEAYLDNLKKLRTNTSEVNSPTSDKYLSDKVKKLLKNVESVSVSDFNSDFTNGKNLIESKKIKKLDPQTYKKVFDSLKPYFIKNIPNYELKDVAFYIAGKGSLGRYRYVAMLQNASKNNLFIDIKEAVQPNSAVIGRTMQGNQAERVVKYSKFFLSKPNSFFGTTNINGLDFFVRSITTDDKVDLAKLNKESEMKDFVDTIAYVVAKAHSKSNKNDKILSESERVMKITDFAKNYAEQVKADFNQFRQNI